MPPLDGMLSTGSSALGEVQEEGCEGAGRRSATPRPEVKSKKIRKRPIQDDGLRPPSQEEIEKRMKFRKDKAEALARQREARLAEVEARLAEALARQRVCL